MLPQLCCIWIHVCKDGLWHLWCRDATLEEQPRSYQCGTCLEGELKVMMQEDWEDRLGKEKSRLGLTGSDGEDREQELLGDLGGQPRTEVG